MVRKNRSKRAKKCSVCDKILGINNKSGLCGHHRQMKWKTENNLKKIKKHICIECNKKVEPTILYPAGDKVPPIIRYLQRCYECKIRHHERQQILTKQKEKTVKCNNELVTGNKFGFTKLVTTQ